MEKDLADHSANDTTRATASLPGLEIELVHRKPRDAEVEAFSINLQAMPSFEAFEHFLEAANPFAFWAQALQMAWRLARSKPRADAAVDSRRRHAQSAKTSERQKRLIVRGLGVPSHDTHACAGLLRSDGPPKDVGAMIEPQGQAARRPATAQKTMQRRLHNSIAALLQDRSQRIAAG